jgi:hypothetical protein
MLASIFQKDWVVGFQALINGDPLEWCCDSSDPLKPSDIFLVFCFTSSLSLLFSRRLMCGYTSRIGLNVIRLKESSSQWDPHACFAEATQVECHGL